MSTCEETAPRHARRETHPADGLGDLGRRRDLVFAVELRYALVVGACGRRSEGRRADGARRGAPWWALLPPAVTFLSVATTAPARLAYLPVSARPLSLTILAAEDIPLRRERGQQRRGGWARTGSGIPFRSDVVLVTLGARALWPITSLASQSSLMMAVVSRVGSGWSKGEVVVGVGGKRRVDGGVRCGAGPGG